MQVEKELIHKVNQSNLKVTGNKIGNMALESKSILINLNMKVITLKVKRAAEVFTLGKMDLNMMVNGRITFIVVMESNLLQIIIDLVDSGQKDQ